jgi:uncharacterized protein
MDIYEACAAGKLTEVMSILAVRPELLNSFSPNGLTPLCLACQYSRSEMAEFLVRHGADANLVSKDELNQAPLHFAAIIGNFDIIILLLRRNADRGLRDAFGKTALDYAKANGFEEIAGYLSEF